MPEWKPDKSFVFIWHCVLHYTEILSSRPLILHMIRQKKSFWASNICLFHHHILRHWWYKYSGCVDRCQIDSSSSPFQWAMQQGEPADQSLHLNLHNHESHSTPCKWVHPAWRTRPPKIRLNCQTRPCWYNKNNYSVTTLPIPDVIFLKNILGHRYLYCVVVQPCWKWMSEATEHNLVHPCQTLCVRTSR